MRRAGLGVRGEVTSPTFVIARVHPSLTDGPALVHVDAYRLGGLAELDDLDLDTSLDDAVTVVEWGEGLFGAQAAAGHYFRKDAARLGPEEAARLAVMLPAPKRFEKRPGSAYVVGRAATIAARMGGVDLP